MSRPPDRHAPSGPPEVIRGVAAVIPVDPPLVVVKPTRGRAVWNRRDNEIKVDPQVLDWPVDAQRFLGAHEAAHVAQSVLSLRATVMLLGALVG